MTNGMRVVVRSATRQRVRVALVICPRPLECRSRFFSRLPFGTPLQRFRHLSRHDVSMNYLRMVLYF